MNLKTITYKDLVKKYPYMLDPVYNHLVIDVQGAEYQVIEGMGDLIKQFDTIDCELTAGDKDGKMHYIGQKHQRDVNKLLDKNGFSLQMMCLHTRYTLFCTQAVIGLFDRNTAPRRLMSSNQLRVGAAGGRRVAVRRPMPAGI